MQYLLVLPTLVTVALLFYMGFVVIRNDKSTLNRVFLAFIAVDALWLLSVWVVNTTPWGFNLFMSKFVFAVSLALGVVLHIFTNAFLNLKHKLTYKLFIFGAGAVIVAVTLASNLIIDGVRIVYLGQSTSPFPMYGPLFPLFVGYLLVNILLFFSMLIRHSRRLKASDRNMSLERLRIRSILFGFVGFIVISFLTNLILPTLFSNASPSQFAPLGSLVLTFALFYAIMRYKLFDIRTVVIRNTTYIFLIAFLALVFVVAANLGGSLVTLFKGQQGMQQVFNAVVALIIAISFHPLRVFFDKITNKFFFRDAYDPQVLIGQFNQVLVANIELERLLTQAARIISENLKTEFVLFYLNPTKFQHRRTVGTAKKAFKKEDIEKIVGLLSAVDQDSNVVITEDQAPQSDLRKILDNDQISAFVSVSSPSSDEAAVGYLLLGQKKSGNLYNAQDVQILEIFSKALLIAIQNALSVQEVKVINETLQQRIEDATKELRTSNLQLQRLDEAKDEFVSMASHQLRTPLTSVKGYISMVLEGDVGKITTMQRQLLEEAFTSSERMVHLIGDFLNVSRLQTGKFLIDYHESDLSKVVEQEVNSMQTTAKAHDLTLTYHAPSYFPILYIDEGKIRQVIMNFIDNAIYYSLEETTISVELAIIDGNAVVQVHDTGIGVPKNEQIHLFTKFFRATNARKQRPDGTGIGLFLAKKVIVAHGGSMVFESTEGKGSTFGFRLPIAKLSHAPADNADKLDK